MADVRIPSENTPLDPGQEEFFRQWVAANNVPFDPVTKAPQDYDMRGYWQGLQQGNPSARPSTLDPNDMAPHYPDYYKNPSHPHYSAESRFGQPGDPVWVGDSLQQAGKVLYNDNDATLNPMQKLLKAMGQQ